MIPISQIDPELSIYKENTVVIWGAGLYGREILRLFKNLEIKVAYICDSDPKKWKQEIEGVPIILPQELMKIQLENSEQNNDRQGEILVQLALLHKYEEEVTPQIEAMGINKVICTEECRQMLLFYTKSRSFKKNTKLLDFKKTVTPFGAPNMEQITFEHFFSHQKDLGFFVCMVGKTGDVTMLNTFKNCGLTCTQIHFPRFLNHNLFDKDARIKIVTAVRDPIAQEISAQYQLIGTLGINTFTDKLYTGKENDAQFFWDCYSDRLEKEKLYKLHYLNNISSLSLEKGSKVGIWFDNFKEHIIDILTHPFDQEKGYTIIQEGNFDIFFYQLEKLNNLVPELSEWVGVPFTELVNGNEASSKWIANSYKQAQKELKFSQEYFDMCYNDPYVQHCYSQEDIEKFKDRWRKNIDPNK